MLERKVFKVPDTVPKSLQVVMARSTGSDFTLLDRKIFNILLANSYKEMKSTTIHRINLRDLSSYLDKGSHESMDRINQSLDRLFHGEIEIQYKDEAGDDILLKCHYLSIQRSMRSDGWLDYAFDPILMRYLREPKVYSVIKLPVSTKFKSQYALRLYEVMQNKIGWFAPWWDVSLDEVMNYFEIPTDSSNRRFDVFKTRVVNKAIEEINKYAEFDVTVEYNKVGRGGKVNGLRFTSILKQGHRLAQAADSVKGNRRTGIKRDQDTVDMFSGVSDLEMSVVPTLSEHIINEASQILGNEDSVSNYFEKWLDEYRDYGYGSNFDETFLTWLKLQISKKRDDDMTDVDVDSIFRSLVDGD